MYLARTRCVLYSVVKERHNHLLVAGWMRIPEAVEGARWDR